MLIPINQGKKKKIYLRIANGSIISKKDGVETSFGAISGSLKSIELKEHEYDNKKFKNWHIILADPASSEVYDLSVSRSSGAFKSIVRSLVTEQGLASLDDINIEVYTSKSGYTNASVTAAGQRLHWVDEQMPAITYVKVGENEVADDTAQMNWIQTLVDRINTMLNAAEEMPQEEDDLPLDDDLPQGC